MSELPSRLAQQLAFIVEIDKLKAVLRQTELIDGSRRENSAEHSWHIATMALVLHEYAGEAVDVRHTLRMLLIHDIVEVDAGDTFAFDVSANTSKADREQLAAERLFSLLPEEQGQALRALWEEFEAGVTPEARYANALDRLAGLISNYYNRGGTWRRFQVHREAVLRRMEPIRVGAPELWPFVLRVIEEATADGSIVA
jgi:putative hydrolases of HD superfamily